MKIIFYQKDIEKIMIEHLYETFSIDVDDIMESNFYEQYGLSLERLTFDVRLKNEE